MDTKGCYESGLQKIGLSCDAFTTGCIAMCVLFIAPYSVSLGDIVIWFLPIVCITPVVVMPLVYVLVHRADTVLFGRYHFIMPVSAFAGILFFVAMWNANVSGSKSAISIFFCALIFINAVLIYRYCAFSVRVRLGNDGVFAVSLPYKIISAVAIAAALIAFIGFMYYDFATVYSNAAYVLGGMCTIAVMVQYLTTYYGIPKLGGKRVISVKGAFKSFYGELDKSSCISSLLFEAAFTTIAALYAYFGFSIVGIDKTLIAISALVGFYILGGLLCGRFVKRAGMRLAVFILICALFSSTGEIVGAILCGDIGFACMICTALFCGIGGAALLHRTKITMPTAMPNITGGIAYILPELTLVSSCAIAFCVAAVVSAIIKSTSGSAFIYGFATAAVFAIAAFAIVLKQSGKSRRNVEINTDRHDDCVSFDTNISNVTEVQL